MQHALVSDAPIPKATTIERDESLSLSSQHAHEDVAHEADNDPPHEQADGDVHHLVPVPPAAAGDEVRSVVDVGELLGLGDALAEEVAQGLPALLDAELEQAVRVAALVGGEAHALLVVAAVDVLAAVDKVALEEGVEEHLEHGVVHLGGPGAREAEGQVGVGEHAQLGVRRAPVDGGQGRLVPRVHVTARKHDLGLGVHLHQLLGKGTRGPVAHGLAVAQQLVPELAGADRPLGERGTLGEVLGHEGVVPQQGVWWVLDGGAHHVVGLDVAEMLHCRAHSCGSSVSIHKLQRWGPLARIV